MTPIALAALEGQLDVVKELAARNANLEAKVKYGKTPIALAANKGQLDVVKELAARNANLKAIKDQNILRTLLSPMRFFDHLRSSGSTPSTQARNLMLYSWDGP